MFYYKQYGLKIISLYLSAVKDMHKLIYMFSSFRL